MNAAINLTVYCLACYRLAILLSSDTGPYHFLSRFRSFLKREAKQHPAVRKSAVHEGVQCLRCTSIWLAIPLAMFKCFHAEIPYWISLTGDVVIYGLALSAAAILLHRVMPPK